MNVGELKSHLRMRLVSMGLPALIDKVLVSYIDNAYKAFVGELLGVADEYTVNILANATEITLPTYVMKIKAARRSDGRFVKVINRGDTYDEGINRQIGLPGELKYLLIGTKPNTAKLICTPTAALTLVLDVDRLPVADLALDADTVDDVGDIWQLDMLDHAVAAVMRMSKDPAVRNRATEFEARFMAQAAEARRSKARNKSKQTRTVAYGGL